MEWIWKNYLDLDDCHLKHISRLRKSFFAEDSKYEFVKDHYDEMSLHLLGFLKKDLVAYGRVIPPHKEFENPYLSRIIISEGFRNKGFGKALISELIDKSREIYPKNLIKVSSLSSTVEFYKKNNFTQQKLIIDDAGKEHFILIKDD